MKAATLFLVSMVTLTLLPAGHSIDYEQILNSFRPNVTNGESSITESLLETRASSETYEDAFVVDDDVEKDVDNESLSFLPLQEPILPSSNQSEASESTVKKMLTLPEFVNNASSSESSFPSEASSAVDVMTNSFVTSSSSSELKEPGEEVTSLREEEGDDVVLGPHKGLNPLPKSILQKTMEWMGDAYTMSILLPIGAGIVFAATLIVSIALCRCMRKRCRRRRMRRKTLPDSVKNLRPSDRARLLAESSDDEF
ncbi:uncharacterized protein LOC129232604 [Uloborus diversus]|uniref:uncharacterized protein LOC129232604 n=1 Tax=Uloborus diversus TaxID=327109 RepID=UPI00240954BE|nr:uncharacterized protein LOC129232604 [Uloborus diversus]